LLGIVVAVIAAKILKRTVLRGESPPFLMELPSYKWPSLRTVLMRVMDRAYSFLRLAGTVILAVSILVWAALYYPRAKETIDPATWTRRMNLDARLAETPADAPQRASIEEQLAEIDRGIEETYQRQSYLGRFGRTFEPFFRPLGWDWRIGSAVIASFPARETVVATLGVIFNAGDLKEGGRNNDSPLHTAVWEGTDRPLFNVPVALSVMVFYALCAQCAATLAVIRQETSSWRWPAFTFAYMTTLAYFGAMATYQVGMWIGG
jgi:ferrous iron transport protein B